MVALGETHGKPRRNKQTLEGSPRLRNHALRARETPSGSVIHGWRCVTVPRVSPVATLGTPLRGSEFNAHRDTCMLTRSCARAPAALIGHDALALPFAANSLWYAFQPGHQPVCHRQIRAINESGLRSAYARNLHFSQLDFTDVSSFLEGDLLYQSSSRISTFWAMRFTASTAIPTSSRVLKYPRLNRTVPSGKVPSA